MATPRRPSGGRPAAGRPAAGRPSRSRAPAGRRPARPAGRTWSATGDRSRASDESPGRRTSVAVRTSSRGPSQLTRRAVVLGLVVVVLVVLTALPLREYLAQRAQISELQQEHVQARRSVAALEDERRRLQDPAYVAAEARRRLHFVLPGETAYVLVDVPPPVPNGPVDRRSTSQAPWFSQLWGSVREADRPASP